MEQINPKNSNKIKNGNHLKLLGKKKIRFTVEKYPYRKKNSYPIKYQKENLKEGRWSYTEQIKFIKALSKDGPNWKKINETINFRTLTQIRSHAQKFFKRLKRCKNNELGIDFTKNSIKSFKDMINHIKLVNRNYDINNVLLYLSDINQKILVELTQKSNGDELPRLIAAIVGCNFDELTNRQNEFFNKSEINTSNTSSQIDNKDNNYVGLNNLNDILLLSNLNLSKSIATNNLIRQLYTTYLENLNKALFNTVQFSIINSQNNLNNSNINKMEII